MPCKRLESTTGAALSSPQHGLSMGSAPGPSPTPAEPWEHIPCASLPGWLPCCCHSHTKGLCVPPGISQMSWDSARGAEHEPPSAPGQGRLCCCSNIQNPSLSWRSWGGQEAAGSVLLLPAQGTADPRFSAPFAEHFFFLFGFCCLSAKQEEFSTPPLLLCQKTLEFLNT